MNDIDKEAERTLALVRALSEHQLKRDPDCNWRPKSVEQRLVVPFEPPPRFL